MSASAVTPTGRGAAHRLIGPEVRDEQAAAGVRHVLDIGDDRVASLRCFFGDQVVAAVSWS
jgi:hypothetical protein